MIKPSAFSLLWLATSIQGVAQTAPMITWEEAIGGAQYDSARECVQTADGGYIVAGNTESDDGHVTGLHGMNDWWVVKLNAFGLIQWQRTLGGTESDGLAAIQQTTDGGYICAGYTASDNGDVTGNHGLMDAWVVKLDPVGDITWQRCLGGSGYELSYDVAQTADGGYLVSTQTDSDNGDVTFNHGLHDSWIIKLDPSGGLTWQTSLGGSGYDYLRNILFTEDGRTILAGGTTSNDGDVSGNHGGYDFWVVELSSVGSITWQKLLGGSANEIAGGLALSDDAGLVMCGYTLSNDGDVSGNHGGSDIWVVKLDGSGDIVWQRSLGGTMNENGTDMVTDEDGDIAVLGYTPSMDGDVTGGHGDGDMWLLKLNATGDLLWQKPLGGSLLDLGVDMDQTTDGGYVLSGLSRSSDGDVSLNQGEEDAWIVKLTAEGVGIPEFTAPEFVVAPNPVSGQLRITSHVPQTFTQVTMADATGRIVLTTSMSGNTLTCDVAHLARGAYILTLRSALGIWCARLVLE